MEKLKNNQEDERKKPITQLISKEQRELASQLFKCIVQISFPNTEQDSILIASSDSLVDDEVVEFIENIGLKADNYRIQYWCKQEKQERYENN